jgi:hypothetical protein
MLLTLLKSDVKLLFIVAKNGKDHNETCKGESEVQSNYRGKAHRTSQRTKALWQ